MAIIPADEKVFMVDKRTNTTYGGSQALQDMQQWYTMQDVADSVQPYKVFTALLTQSGGDDPYNIGAENPVTLGITYNIAFNSNDVDLTVFGAPNSNVGTHFICTTAGTLPNDPDLLLRYNSGAPVATVLENTIGNIWFTYTGVGNYGVNSNGLFTLNKTWQSPTNYNLPNDITEGYNFAIFDNNSGAFFVFQEGNLQDSSLVNTPIEIRVYN